MYIAKIIPLQYCIIDMKSFYQFLNDKWSTSRKQISNQIIFQVYLVDLFKRNNFLHLCASLECFRFILPLLPLFFKRHLKQVARLRCYMFMTRYIKIYMCYIFPVLRSAEGRRVRLERRNVASWQWVWKCHHLCAQPQIHHHGSALWWIRCTYSRMVSLKLLL